MTIAKMQRVWDWMAARLVDPPEAPKFKVSPFFLPVNAAGRYINGTLVCKPWASRIIVIHEAAHYLWGQWRMQHLSIGFAFLTIIRRSRWDQAAIETWCATLTAILVDRPGVWKQPISGAMPNRGAVWAFTPFLKEKP